MRWRNYLVCVLTMTLLPGCISDQGNDSDDPEGPEVSTLTANTAPGAAQHCKDTVAFFMREPAAYQALLPENYTTRDAKDLADGFGLPVGSGQGAAYVSGYECPASEHAAGAPLEAGEVAVLIQPPTLSAEGPTTPATLDFYLKNWHTNSSAHQDVLERYGVPHTPANVTVEMNNVGPRHMGSIVIEDGSPLVSYRFDGMESEAYTGTVRIWHESALGIAWTDLLFDAAPNGKGTITDCSFRAGSIYAEAFGGTDCADQPGLALIFYDQSYGGSFNFLPGVYSTK